MDNDKKLVVTVYGHDRTVDKLAVNSFAGAERGVSEAEIYCTTINDLKLEGNFWVFAKMVSANVPYTLHALLPLKFDAILLLDDRSTQRLLQEVDGQDISIALKGDVDEPIKQKIFSNMSKRVAAMLKEDMEFMGEVRRIDVWARQEKIIDIIRRLEDKGEITLDYQGETVE